MTRSKTATTTSLSLLKSTGSVLTAYLLLTVLMTWPTVLHLTDGIPGDGFDGWQNYWNLWWVKEALLGLGTSPYFTDYLYPPIGTNLLFHTLNIFNGLWTLPLQLNFGLAIAYNSVVFFSFVFAGYGAYLLSLYTLSQLKLGRPATWRPAAFVGGLIFTMSPFHMAHLLGHMQVFSMMWPPFYILWLLRTLRPWASPAPIRYARRDIALTCLFLILATSIDWYHTLYLLMFTGLVLVWAMWSQVKQGSRGAGERGQNFSPAPLSLRSPAILRPLWPVLAIGLGFALVFAPLLLPMIREAGSRPDLETGLAQNITLSADLLAFFLPSEMHPVWGDWAANIAANFTTTTSERLIFAGFVPLTLAILAATRLWRHAMVKFWSVIVLLFFGLALGPFLHLNGQTITLGNQPLPLPYLLLYHTIPFIDLTRSLSRYDLMVMLGLGMLAAIALVNVQLTISNYQLSITNPQGKRYQLPITNHQLLRTTHYALRNLALPFIATTLICFEFLPIPYPISRLEIPQFYRDIATDPEQYTIAELPLNWDRPTPLLHQTVHHKRLLTAYTSRNNPLELAWRTPVLQQWRYLGPDIIDQPLAEIAPTIFFDFNLRYIVLDYWQMPPGPERVETERWVAAALPNASPIYDDGRLKVYQTPAKGETQPYLSLGQGWGDRQVENDQVSRRLAAPQTELFLHHPQNQPLRLEITAAGSQQLLTLSANGQPLTSWEVVPTLASHQVSLPLLPDELVKLELSAADPTRPISITRLTLRPGSEE